MLLSPQTTASRNPDIRYYKTGSEHSYGRGPSRCATETGDVVEVDSQPAHHGVSFFQQ